MDGVSDRKIFRRMMAEYRHWLRKGFPKLAQDCKDEARLFYKLVIRKGK